jgi:DNA gyrase subunit A
MIITKQGQIIRIDSSEIRKAGRSTQGVKLVNVEAGDQVAAASLIPDTVVPDLPVDGQEDLPLQ